VVAVEPDSPAGRAGVLSGDVLERINGEQPRDVIRYQLLVDEPRVSLEIGRGGLTRTIDIDKAEGQPLGIEVHAAVFDQVRTCDNHCGFCFIYQLPEGMRRSLYLKDDDYRLSFLYGNFTTLTRFTEADLERVITEGLSPLYVSIHATDRAKRAELLRNRRGATSLRWLRALLEAGVEVHGQIVVCPGVNDGEVLDETLLGVLDEYPELASLAVVPLGVSDHSDEPEMRPHTRIEAEAVIDLVEEWQAVYLEAVGRRLAFVADEYYLLADRPFPEAGTYDGFAMHEDGIGMARTFEAEFHGLVDRPTGPAAGFFSWVDGAPARGYRSARLAPGPADNAGCGGGGDRGTGAGPTASPVTLRRRDDRPVGILTGVYGARVLGPMIGTLGRPDVRLIPVENRFFGGNIAVTGLLVGADLARELENEPEGDRYLLPDVCLSGGRFLDGTTPDELPRPVEIVATDGIALRRALAAAPPRREVVNG
jgi:putative radical SAM enzyme (TIGR03279 family)